MFDPTVFALFVVSALAVSVVLRRRRTALPPGPKGLPIVGNIFDVPKEFEWLAYARWSKDLRTYPCAFPLTIMLLTSLPTYRLRCYLPQSCRDSRHRRQFCGGGARVVREKVLALLRQVRMFRTEMVPEK